MVLFQDDSEAVEHLNVSANEAYSRFKGKELDARKIGMYSSHPDIWKIVES